MVKFDVLPVSTLDDFHKFREAKFNFTYLCRKCLRSFDSVDEQNKCKFCEGQIIELRSVHREKKGIGTKSVTYRYFCSTCEKSFTTADKMAFCTNCKTNYLHVYTWDKLRRREKFYIRFRKAVNNVFLEKKQPATKNGKAVKNEEGQKESRFFGLQARRKEELPTY